MKPLALDLCCGKGGWTNGLLKAGWDVIGVDIEDMGGYPSKQIFADVREIAKDVEAYFPALKFDLVVASPPCQEFSYSSLPFKKCKAKFTTENPPDKSIWMACVKIAQVLNVPLVLENVRGAKKWMGPASWHYGSFYFWGELPALIPIGSPKKGFGRVDKEYEKRTGKHDMRGDRPKGYMPGEYERVNGVGNGVSRKEWSARIAMVPSEIGEWIGRCFYPMENKKVKFINCSDAQANWGHGQDPRKYLEVGKTYTLVHAEVNSFHTLYHLKEFPNKCFNSVCFE